MLFVLGLSIGISITSAVWFFICKKQNDDWRELCQKQRNDWIDVCNMWFEAYKKAKKEYYSLLDKGGKKR